MDSGIRTATGRHMPPVAERCSDLGARDRISCVDNGMTLEHEEVLVRRGPRSGLPIVVAVHSTALGQAVGGLRMWHYPDWRDGLTDALRLARGMTYKAAAAGATKGGGKTVVALPGVASAALRRDALLDAGDVIE